MNLVIFDIDGTLVDSVKTDDECFVQTFKNLYNIDLSASKWTDFTNVTDLGLTTEIFEQNFGQKPTKSEIVNIKTYFYDLLSKRQKNFNEIQGAVEFVETLRSTKNFEIAVATGGWKETALLKTKSICLDLSKTVLKSSNDHFNRAEIIKMAIATSAKKKNLKTFESVTYIGDGIWDFKVSLDLGLKFIGIDNSSNGNLKKAGAKIIFSDFKKKQEIINWTLKSSATIKV